MNRSRRIIVFTAFALLGIVGGNGDLPLIFCASMATVAGGAYIPAGRKQ